MVHGKPHIEGKIYDINDNKYKGMVKNFVKKINKHSFCNSYKYVFVSQNSKKLERLFKNLISEARAIEQLRGKNNTVAGL